MNLMMRSLWVLTVLSSLASTVFAHVQMTNPVPIRSPKDTNHSYSNVDYDYTSPLNPDGSNYPCKGYQTDRPVHDAATYDAGQTYEMTLDGSATHGGGSCQISLSYDGGETFKVIKSMIGGCPLTETYNFTIPSSAPSGDALLAWTWLNYEGNREFYMNCAWVQIDGSDNGSLDSLPNIWVANIKGVTDCTTTETTNPVFPDPGPDVEYGDGMSSSSPATLGDCETGSSGNSSSTLGDADSSSSASSNSDHSGGMFFENAAFNPQAAPTSAPPAAPTIQTMALAAPISTSQPIRPLVFAAMSVDTMYLPPVSTAIYTTVTVEESCTNPPDVTITIWTTSVTVSPTSTTSCGYGYYSTRIAGSGIMCRPYSMQTPATTLKTTSSITPSKPTGTTPPYATDTTLYLPCVPGSFLCTSSTNFLTCGQTNSGWTWLYPRSVAAGMQCLPYLSQGGSTSYTQQPGSPPGYYRDDRYVRARPYGSCPTDGAYQCVNGGAGFQVCDHGGWVDMGPVAAGTQCIDGKIAGSY